MTHSKLASLASLLFLFAFALASSGRAETQVVWEETPTHRIKIKLEDGVEVGRWEFARKTPLPPKILPKLKLTPVPPPPSEEALPSPERETREPSRSPEVASPPPSPKPQAQENSAPKSVEEPKSPPKKTPSSGKEPSKAELLAPGPGPGPEARSPGAKSAPSSQLAPGPGAPKRPPAPTPASPSQLAPGPGPGTDPKGTPSAPTLSPKASNEDQPGIPPKPHPSLSLEAQESAWIEIYQAHLARQELDRAEAALSEILTIRKRGGPRIYQNALTLEVLVTLGDLLVERKKKYNADKIFAEASEMIDALLSRPGITPDDRRFLYRAEGKIRLKRESYGLSDL